MDQDSSLHDVGHDGGPFALVDQAWLNFQDAVAMVMSHVRQKVIQGFLVVSFVFLLLWIATFLYGSFYYSYMPKPAFSTPVHYYYRTDCESPGSFSCSYPVANISLMSNRKHVLTFGQAYRMSLQLEMPDSPTNRELGMFMIKITCFCQDGGQVASSARPVRQQLAASSSRFVSTALTHNNLFDHRARLRLLMLAATEGDLSAQEIESMLRYHSDLLRYLRTLLFLPALLSGVTEQKQVLEVELFTDYVDDPYVPSVTAVIEILSNKVQIYSSELNVHAQFTGIRYFLFNFPLLSALIGVSSNFMFLSLLFILSYLRMLFRVDWGSEQHRRDGQLSANNQVEDTNNAAADTAEQMDALQLTTTNLSQERPRFHFCNSTEVRNRRVRCRI